MQNTVYGRHANRLFGLHADDIHRHAVGIVRWTRIAARLLMKLSCLQA